MRKAASKRLAGVELEYNEEGGDSRLPRGASIHEDGSCGSELVTPPRFGRSLTKMLKSSCAWLKDAEQDDRCSMHVHVDARDMHLNAVASLALLYSRCEPLLFLLAGQHRANNQYCTPNGHRFAKTLMKAIRARDNEEIAYALRRATFSNVRRSRDYLYETTSGVHFGKLKLEEIDTYKARLTEYDRQLTRRDGNRYVALNLCPWFSGRHSGRANTTIEFRMHRETKNAARAIGWVKLLVAMVDYAKRSTFESLLKLLDSESNEAKILAQIGGRAVGNWIAKRLRIYRSLVPSKCRRIHFTKKDGYRWSNRVLTKTGAVSQSARFPAEEEESCAA